MVYHAEFIRAICLVGASRGQVLPVCSKAGAGSATGEKGGALTPHVRRKVSQHIQCGGPCLGAEIVVLKIEVQESGQRS